MSIYRVVIRGKEYEFKEVVDFRKVKSKRIEVKKKSQKGGSNV